jgi:hypothetical protein
MVTVATSVSQFRYIALPPMKKILKLHKIILYIQEKSAYHMHDIVRSEIRSTMH